MHSAIFIHNLHTSVSLLPTEDSTTSKGEMSSILARLFSEHDQALYHIRERLVNKMAF